MPPKWAKFDFDLIKEDFLTFLFIFSFKIIKEDIPKCCWHFQRLKTTNCVLIRVSQSLKTTNCVLILGLVKVL